MILIGPVTLAAITETTILVSCFVFQATAIHLKILAKTTQSSNVLQGLDYMTGTSMDPFTNGCMATFY